MVCCPLSDRRARVSTATLQHIQGQRGQNPLGVEQEKELKRKKELAESTLTQKVSAAGESARGRRTGDAVSPGCRSVCQWGWSVELMGSGAVSSARRIICRCSGVGMKRLARRGPSTSQQTGRC